jgi:NarL family two-component system response regulator LiaR
MKKIRLLIVDDQTVVREGLAAILAYYSDIEVVGQAEDGNKALALIEQAQPDVILLDLVMPGMDGLTLIPKIKELAPDTRILVVTSFAETERVFQAIKAGALGYLLKDSSPEQLLDAIRMVHKGEPSLEPSIARKVLQELSNPGQGKPTTDPLTEREMEVLRLIAQGMSNKEIAAAIFVAEWTVRSHVSNILAKLQLASRTQAALYALRSGIASLEDVPTNRQV